EEESEEEAISMSPPDQSDLSIPLQTTARNRLPRLRCRHPRRPFLRPRVFSAGAHCRPAPLRGPLRPSVDAALPPAPPLPHLPLPAPPAPRSNASSPDIALPYPRQK